jgi:hypothetical protein
MQKVVEGVRAEPPAADCFTDKTWELINLCWQDDPTKRPDAREILHSLGVPSSPAYILLRRPGIVAYTDITNPVVNFQLRT